MKTVKAKCDGETCDKECLCTEIPLKSGTTHLCRACIAVAACSFSGPGIPKNGKGKT